MEHERRILLFGASTRAAAFSAVRAGLQPWCADLFADRDLQRLCDVVAVRGKYPSAFREALRSAPRGPWMYTGGLENHPRLVGEMSGVRELWGNDVATLTQVRNPLFVAETVRAAGLPCPAAYASGEMLPRSAISPGRRWVIKPVKGAGGRGISFWAEGQMDRVATHNYLQEFVEGDAVAAIYVGDGRLAQLLGMTRQLIGSLFCHAMAFQYCGSVGPVGIDKDLQGGLERLGDVLTAACHLRGLFGIDGVLRDGDFWSVEVNPRYTASIEVLEYATQVRGLSWHRAVFDPQAGRPPLPSIGADIVGKAILMAKQDMVFPDSGPWESILKNPPPLDEMPELADIPEPGERIRAGRPVLTLFARGGSLAACTDELQRRAIDLDRWLFPA